VARSKTAAASAVAQASPAEGASAGTVGEVDYPTGRAERRRFDQEIADHGAETLTAGVREVPTRQALTYTSNSATTASVSLSGLNSPAWASSTILIATSSATGMALGPFNRNRIQTCPKALCISSIWSGRKNGALRRRPLIASLNLEAPCATRP
jgi:hypothetical protein